MCEELPPNLLMTVNTSKRVCFALYEKKNLISCILCLHFISPHFLHNREGLIPRKASGVYVYHRYTDIPFVFCIQSCSIHPSKFTHMFMSEWGMPSMSAKFCD